MIQFWNAERCAEAIAELRAERSVVGGVAAVCRRLSARWGREVTGYGLRNRLLEAGHQTPAAYLGGVGERDTEPAPITESVPDQPRHPRDRSFVAPPPPPKLNGERVVVIPDLHCPYHDHRAWGVALEAIRIIKPTTIVVIGDFADAYAVSFFPKSPERRQSLRWEIDETNKALDQLKGLSDRLVYTCGNHEERLERFLCQRAPELYGLVSIKDLLRIKDRGWEWVPYKQWIRIGKTAFTHELGHCGKYAMPQSLDAFGGNLVIGHTHRAGVWYDGTVDGDHRFAMNVGWLGDANEVDYMHRAKMRAWQHGLGLVEQDDAGNSWATFVPIVGGRMMVRGERIAA